MVIETPEHLTIKCGVYDEERSEQNIRNKTGQRWDIKKNGVLRKLKHIFPNTYQRIKSICSLAKGGTGCYRFNYQPGS